MKYQIFVTGSSHRGLAPEKVFEVAGELGKTLGESGQNLVVDDMHSIGPRVIDTFRKSKKSGLVIGVSPASNRYEHQHTYKLPTDEFDVLEFTGGEYIGRDTIAVRSADAIVIAGGETGSLHVLATALELGKIIGVVAGSGGVADLAPSLVEQLAAHHRQHLIIDSDPARLIRSLVIELDSHR